LSQGKCGFSLPGYSGRYPVPHLSGKTGCERRTGRMRRCWSGRRNLLEGISRSKTGDEKNPPAIVELFTERVLGYTKL